MILYKDRKTPKRIIINKGTRIWLRMEKIDKQATKTNKIDKQTTKLKKIKLNFSNR